MNPLEGSGKPLFFKVAGETPSGAPTEPVRLSVRTAARSLSVMQKEALVHSTLGGARWRLSSDEGAYLDGDDVAPCPLAHMTTGMVASFMEALQRVARDRGIALPGVRLVQDNYYTMQGSALRGTMRGGALPIELAALVEGDTDPKLVESLLDEAVHRAPVYGLIGSVLHSRFTLTHNGREVDLDPSKAIPSPAVALEAGTFDAAEPQPGDWSPLMRRGGLSPATDEITSSSGSSYADEQSRTLHVRGICSLRDDGVKSIEQQLFNPHGSIFYVLSEEGIPAGGLGRAPDALSYVSAGIAFCFLTQFGRYAKIIGQPLREYGVVQDTQFSVPEARRRASAAPVETHVHLETDQDDDFARKALEMSEQTCFLHALCRSEVAVHVRSVAASSPV